MKKTIIGLLFGAYGLFALEVVQYNGDKVFLDVSASSVNKIILPSKIKNKAYSKEKNLQIQLVGNIMYVKFTPQTEQTQAFDEQGKPLPLSGLKMTYQKAMKNELFVETDTGTYLLILNPVGREAETFKILDPNANSQKAYEYETKDPYRETIKKLTSSAFDFFNGVGLLPDGYEATQFGGDSYPYGTKLQISPAYRLKGKLFSAYIYSVKNITSSEVVSEPKGFLKIPLKGKLSISSFDERIIPYSSTVLVIIAKEDGL